MFAPTFRRPARSKARRCLVRASDDSGGGGGAPGMHDVTDVRRAAFGARSDAKKTAISLRDGGFFMAATSPFAPKKKNPARGRVRTLASRNAIDYFLALEAAREA
ncbi:hypothetical protein PanNE5_40860 [Pandoraea sp. NE5]|nr:hypothetical protein PanNE5_40860 [Pandoraea sp. NE5]